MYYYYYAEYVDWLNWGESISISDFFIENSKVFLHKAGLFSNNVGTVIFYSGLYSSIDPYNKDPEDEYFLIAHRVFNLLIIALALTTCILFFFNPYVAGLMVIGLTAYVALSLSRQFLSLMFFNRRSLFSIVKLLNLDAKTSYYIQLFLLGVASAVVIYFAPIIFPTIGALLSTSFVFVCIAFAAITAFRSIFGENIFMNTNLNHALQIYDRPPPENERQVEGRDKNQKLFKETHGVLLLLFSLLLLISVIAVAFNPVSLIAVAAVTGTLVFISLAYTAYKTITSNPGSRQDIEGASLNNIILKNIVKKSPVLSILFVLTITTIFLAITLNPISIIAVAAVTGTIFFILLAYKGYNYMNSKESIELTQDPQEEQGIVNDKIEKESSIASTRTYIELSDLDLIRANEILDDYSSEKSENYSISTGSSFSIDSVEIDEHEPQEEQGNVNDKIEEESSIASTRTYIELSDLDLIRASEILDDSYSEKSENGSISTGSSFSIGSVEIDEHEPQEEQGEDFDAKKIKKGPSP